MLHFVCCVVAKISVERVSLAVALVESCQWLLDGGRGESRSQQQSASESKEDDDDVD